MTPDDRIKMTLRAIAALDMFCMGQLSLRMFNDWWSEHWKDAA